MVFTTSQLTPQPTSKAQAFTQKRWVTPAEYEALMPDPQLLETLSVEEYDALIPDGIVLQSDEPEMENSLHFMQIVLLVTCLEFLWRDRTDFFIGANLTIYYSRQQIKTRDYRGPDIFFVKDVERKPRGSWVLWEEDYRFPNLIIELLSDSTAKTDRGSKKNLYSQEFKTPEYFWFGPKTLEFAGFRLVDGEYIPIEPNDRGQLWSEELGLFFGIANQKLRFFFATGEMVPTPEEYGDQKAVEAYKQERFARQQAQLARVAEERSLRLAEKLRSLGIDPDEI